MDAEFFVTALKSGMSEVKSESAKMGAAIVAVKVLLFMALKDPENPATQDLRKAIQSYIPGLDL